MKRYGRLNCFMNSLINNVLQVVAFTTSKINLSAGMLFEFVVVELKTICSEGNGKETNTNDAIQVSTNRPQSQGGCIDLQRTKNGVKQVPNSSYQVSRSSPQLQCNKKSAPEANDGSRHTSKASSQIQCDGEIESTNPEAKVHHMVLGPDCWKVWVTVVKVENISLYRPTSEFRVLEDDVSSTIAWPSKYVRVGE
ncbi:uncharacterized protein LOC126607755 [Malus sylvestris]|uniref:uncharacterized protein LOC126607755 n=1 Tax=Malus sylvestris TaxID=3752 RepID=UPI0021ABE8F8|nr:uncharacterized protein LOC126607755 [Malus sylvestris]